MLDFAPQIIAAIAIVGFSIIWIKSGRDVKKWENPSANQAKHDVHHN